MADKGGFPFISFLDAYVVVPPPEIYFHEVLRALEFVNKMRDERKRVIISNCVLIQVVVVLHHPFATVLLWNKEYGTGLL